MSRQAQNILTGAVACLVAAIAVVTVIIALNEDSDQVATGPLDPLAPGAAEDVATAGSLPTPAPTSPSALAVTIEQTSSTTATTVLTATTATTVATTVPTTVAVTTSIVGTTASTVDAGSSTTDPATGSSSTDTTAAGATTTAAGGSSSTSSGSSTTAGNTTTTSGQSTTSQATTTTTVSSGGGSMNAIEREIARLTNELRTNPNGPLKREGAAIDCSGRVAVDLGTGQYEAIGAVTISETASVQVARPWSAQMTVSNFEHQPNAGVAALQAAGISVRSAGENIAYHNYPDKAMFHFTGWRESDGHFCNMMNPGFTHLGVGEVTKSDGISYATQNFYSTR